MTYDYNVCVEGVQIPDDVVKKALFLYMTRDMESEPERLAARLDTSIYYDDMKAANLIRTLTLQREDDKQAMADTLEVLERYQIKRQDFDRFAVVVSGLRSRLDLGRLV